MGRASKWFRGLLSFRKPDSNGEPPLNPPSKRKWSFPKGKHRRKSVTPGAYVDDDETSRQAIAVAAATAAVAEAAVAAAHAAAAVAQLTTGGCFERPAACIGGNVAAGYVSREERAAVVIQSHFRAYLSRRALRALKALVKLQALVRGHILRKQNVDKLRQLQALVRAQARTRASRGPLSEAPHSSTRTCRFNHTVRAPHEKVDHTMVATRSTKHDQPTTSSKRSNNNLVYDQDKSPLIHHWMERRKGETTTPWEQGSFITRIVRVDDSKSDKVLDDRHSSITPVPRNILHSSQPSHISDQYSTYSLSKETASASASASAQTTWLSTSSGGVQSLSPLTLALNSSGSPFYTANNSPAYCSASSVDGNTVRAPFTPAKSSCYSDHPSYMAYTESSKAKARSLSAPKQRPQWERSSCSQWERSNSVNRYSVQRERERESVVRVSTQKTNASLSTRGYPGSGRLDKYGMPVRDVSGFSGGLWHRY